MVIGMDMPLLIGLHGRARAGKDTVGQILVRQGLDRIAFADPIKGMLLAMPGIEPAHLDSPLKEQVIPWLGRSPRQLMQTLGTEWGRERVHPDLWTVLAGREIAASRTMGRGCVVTDVRFENEAHFIRHNGGQVWHIIRESAAVAAHTSEDGIPLDLIDRTIDNTGTLDHTERQVIAAYEAAVLQLSPLDWMETGA